MLQFEVPQLIVSPHEFLSTPHLPVHAGGRGWGAHAAQPVRTPPHPLLTTAPPPGLHTPGLEQVSGVQQEPVSVLQVEPPLHVSGLGQVMVVPHPVIDETHLPAQSAAVGGTHATHLFPWQTSFPGHVGQITATPHESAMTPHCAPCAAHAGFAETHWWVLSSQTWFDGQEAGLPASLQWKDGSPQLSNVPHALGPSSAQMLLTHASPGRPPSSKKGSASVAESALPSPDPPSPLPACPSSPAWPSSPSVPSSPLPGAPSERFVASPFAVASCGPPSPAIPPAPSEPPHATGATDKRRAPTRDHTPRDPTERAAVYFSRMVKMLGEFRALGASERQSSRGETKAPAGDEVSLSPHG